MRLLSRALYASGETTILLNDVSIHLAELIEAHDRLMYHYQELRFMEIEYNAGTSYQDDEEARENSIRDQFEHDEEDVPGVPRSKSKAGAR